MRRLAAPILALALVAACSGESDAPTAEGASPTTAEGASPTTAEGASPTTAAGVTSTTPSTTSTTVAPVAALAATTTCPEVPARAVPDPDRPRYELRVDVRPAEHLVVGDLTVVFTPDVPTDRLVFRLWPNGPKLRGAGAYLDTGPVSLDGGEPRFGELPDPTTLVVPLGRALRAGETITASLPWQLRLPGAVSDRIARIGDTVRLGSFFPILAWEPGRGWALEPPTSNFAEASSSPTADFLVAVTVPEGLQVLASGVPTLASEVWRSEAVRDVALSVGRFRVVEEVVDGVRVAVGVEEGVREDPAAFLRTIAASLRDFNGRFGPYPWPSYSVAVTPALSGGIEYPMHVLQGPGSGGRTTPHEVAHQWFYSLVGNDQGRDPWLDEGLATWAEARFLGTLGEVTRTSIPADAARRTGAPMRYWNGRSSYYRGVYVQGAQALAAIGPADAVDCGLRQYVARHAYRTATTEDLVRSLEVAVPGARSSLRHSGAVG